MTIREAAKNDYEAIIDIRNNQNIPWPEQLRTAEALRNADARRNPKYIYKRFIAEEVGVPVGVGAFAEQGTYNGKPQFSINIAVREAFRGKGIGTALYDAVFNELKDKTGAVIRADGFTLYPRGMKFLEKQGFKEVWRETPVELDVSFCDLSGLNGLLSKLAGQGIAIRSLAELNDDPDRNRKLFEAYTKMSPQVPSEEGYIWETPDFDEWMEYQINDPSTLLESYFVAVYDNRYIGLKEVGMLPGTNAIQCGLMAVLPEYQHKGIAKAMQLKTIDYARKIGCPVLKSCTATCNTPMQQLYEKLGYVKRYEWAQYMMEL